MIRLFPMKKSKKRKARPARGKGRAKQKQMPKARQRPGAEAASSAELFSGGFDFSASSAPGGGPDLINRSRAELQQGNPEQALALARQALSSSPQDAEALNLAGVAAFQSGQPRDGLDLLRTAVAFAPENAEAQTNLGNVLAALDRPGEAEAAYKAAASADASYAEAAFNLGILMQAQKRFPDALAAYERAVEISPTHSGAHLGLGNARKALMRLDAAREAYEAALHRNPALAEARTNLAAVLQELGDFAGAAREAKRALDVNPELHEARYNYAIALQELGRTEEAIEAYAQVLEGAPDHAACALNIGYGLQQLERLDEAGQAFEKAIAIDPHFAKAHVNLADLRLQQDNPQGALDVCDAFLENHPGQADLLAFKAVCLWDLGREDDARRLTDFARFVRIVHITPPEGFDGLAAFNAALCAHVTSHPSLTLAPQSHATRKGKHSGELLNEPKGPIAGLEAEILLGAVATRGEFGGDESHPFLASPPKHWTLSVWGVVMQGGGHQIPHIHPAAWLSGVYYAQLPDVTGARDSGKAGWIEFGRPPEHFHNRTAPETLSVQPEPGMMVLFPSYFYHHTVPFEASGTRVSIAFDLMAA